ncbi:cytochrome d ubiquinol oxidase subunit II [Cellulomonas shaoxiangyii]|uniref:Cytochrome d ubiquinol oxidase subunit II n=1 Tax=Cellulomonas shaoxiangyii TaxID=2566013 RepID=A0A4P7SKL5_9CELL|nr:cytochrome d ubiquinol oxidase subunit II [Cellulomonas shaoxiangyii]QCB94839.1 cytochrome d ubiquinol oxidase subunit II [Cellulomonas shaoxiangyii]TGY86570.1 cytochrome d ubiquinol oxidase subunit II [Cellulomonas shaoxiangyii]
MTLPDVVAGALLVGVVAYALLGGADFGAGFYDLTAGGAQRGARLRTLIDHSIGPVWEANHVWLIYVLVMAWTAFPRAFTAVMTTLVVPLLLALLGIVLRGASFAFRKYSATVSQARLFGAVFAASSLIAPFFLGTVAGAIASGRVPAGGRGDLVASWVAPTPLIAGVLAVSTSVFLAGTFLTADAARAGWDALTERLRRRALVVGAVTGALVLGALYPISSDAPTLTEGLVGRAGPLVVLSMVAGFGALWLLLRRRFATARVAAVVAVAAVLGGWAVAQYPWLLVDQLTVAEAAGAPATLRALVLVAALAALVVAPPLVYLFRLTQTQEWSAREDHA